MPLQFLWDFLKLARINKVRLEQTSHLLESVPWYLSWHKMHSIKSCTYPKAYNPRQSTCIWPLSRVIGLQLKFTDHLFDHMESPCELLPNFRNLERQYRRHGQLYLYINLKIVPLLFLLIINMLTSTILITKFAW